MVNKQLRGQGCLGGLHDREVPLRVQVMGVASRAKRPIPRKPRASSKAQLMLQRPWQNIGPPSSPSSKKRSGSKRCGWPKRRQTNQALAPSQHSGPANSDRLTLFVKAQLCEIPPCRCVRAPESRLPKASPPRSWRASLILKHAKVLGEVEAPSREAADAPAVQTFNLNPGQCRSAAEESARENMPI